MQLSDALQQIDGMVDLVAALLVEGQPEAIEQGIRQLRDGMAAFSGLAQRFAPDAFTPENVAHMQRISERMTHMRGHLAKVAALTQQQLATLMPQSTGGSHTYGSSSLPPGAAASVAKLYHISG